MPSPPKKGFSKNKGFKYALKNSWDILPGINEFQATKTFLHNISGKKETPFVKFIGRLFLTAGYIIYGTASWATGSLNPKVWSEKVKEGNEKMQLKQQYENKVDSTYNSLFQDTKTFQDSLEIYQKYGLPIKLEPVSFEEKEKIVNENSLEGSLE